MKVRLFRDNSCALFQELKLHVQVFVNQLAGLCHQRVQQMQTEAEGSDLC